VSGSLAVFLDRDGTIIEDAGYLRDPAGVRLLPGAAQAIRQLNEHGLIVVVATNQSGIARGLLTLDQYRATERRVDELLTLQGARLDAHYFCPHVPELSGPCDCRKPGSLLYRQAAERFGIDLPRSWWVGDRVRDLLPAKSFGARGILVLTGAGESEASDERAKGFEKVRDLADAVAVILRPAPSQVRSLES
jgi:D-glycero-D-manno-heptose 1,7-bisphosphate phosphatase